MLTLYLSLQLLCAGPKCWPVGIGKPSTPTPAGASYELTQYAVPEKDRNKYGDSWFQIGNDRNWGIHSYPGPVVGRVSHGCIRVSREILEELEELEPTQLTIIKE